MTTFEITMSDHNVMQLMADAYQQEGPMTTFFTSTTGSGHLDSWSTRQASVRSADVVLIRRVS